MSTRDLDFDVVFIGGAARSGTSVLHALLCTAEKAPGYIAEASYFSAFMHPLEAGLSHFDIHTKYYFESREQLFEQHREILAVVLTTIWKNLGKPDTILLKRPQLTPWFHYLAGISPNIRFVVSVREPLDALASHVEVKRKENHGLFPSAGTVQALCKEYVKAYRSILNHKDEFGKRLTMVRYADFVQGRNLEHLEQAGLGKIFPEKIWSNSITSYSENPVRYWMTALHEKPLTGASINRYQRTLPVQLESVIRKSCGQIAKELGLEIASSCSTWPVRVSRLKNAVTFGLHTAPGVRTLARSASKIKRKLTEMH